MLPSWRLRLPYLLNDSRARPASLRRFTVRRAINCWALPQAIAERSAE
jgi:hypothetical protein